MATEVSIQVGEKYYVIESDHLPPVGATITAHEHLHNGSIAILEVVEHLWELDKSKEEEGRPELRVWLRTRRVEK